MANEHLKTAAANLQRAVQDVHEQQHQIRAQMENVKRDNEQAIKSLEAKMSQLEKNTQSSNNSSSTIVAARTQQTAIQHQISQIKSDTDKFVQQQTQAANGLDGQIREFENLASRLNSLA